MASLAWTVVRIVTASVAAATVTAAGITSGLLLLSTRRSGARLSRMEDEVQAIRHDSDYRWVAHRLWTVDSDHGQDLGGEEK